MRAATPTAAEMAATHAAAFAPERPWSEAEFASLLAQASCLVAGDARCFALFRVVLDEAELLTLATHPAHRRQGLARAAMRDGLTAAAERGATRALLEVAADNSAAVSLYQSCGFDPCGMRRGYYRRAGRVAADALLMACALSPGKRPES